MNANNEVDDEYSERVRELVRLIESLPAERREQLERELEALISDSATLHPDLSS